MIKQRTHYVTTADVVTIGGTVHGDGSPLVSYKESLVMATSTGAQRRDTSPTSSPANCRA